MNGLNVLITGGTGSLGRALVKTICEKYKPKKVIIFSRDEFKQSEMQKEFDYQCLRYFLGDVRDAERVNQVMDGVDVVIHTAALKQVPALEYNPTEAVKTNVLGTMNVINAANANRVSKCIFISTDKAVNPINLYGATKLTAEKLWLAANAYNRCKFSVVRYGNVLGSRGSIVPLFKELAKEGVEIPITDGKMTRFIITLDEAVNLVLFCYDNMKGDEIFVPYIPSAYVTSIAKAINQNCSFKYIGIRKGEKLHEVLISEDTDKVYVVSGGLSKPVGEPFVSNNNLFLTVEQIREKLCLAGLL